MTLAGMAPSTLRVNSYSLSHVGCVREINEDGCFTNAENGIWAVADGMGGHDGGELASEAIIRELGVMGSPESAADLDRRFWISMNRANADILAVSRQRGLGVIGSTVVALLVHGEAFRCLWSGDSRAYLLRDGQLTQMSTDHTEVQDMISRGLISAEEALNYPRRNVILHAIGVHDGVHMDFVDGKILSGDTFLLCSDGLTGHVSDREIAETMTGGRAREICTQLVDLALARGGTDNVTVSIAQFYSASVTIPGVNLMQSAEEIEGSHG